MRSRTWISIGAAGVLLAAPLGPAAAQAAVLRGLPSTGRLTVDGYVSRYRLTLPDTRTRLDGMGARIMWSLAPQRAAERERLAEHLAIGAFVATTPDDDIANGGEVRTALSGVQLDVRPLRAPVRGVLEPVVSLGAGVLTVKRSTPGRWSLKDGTMILPRDIPVAELPPSSEWRRTHAVLAPAAGLLVSPMPDFALRFDVRTLVNRGGTEISTGVSLRI